jgi:hypothetical protein
MLPMFFAPKVAAAMHEETIYSKCQQAKCIVPERRFPTNYSERQCICKAIMSP